MNKRYGAGDIINGVLAVTSTTITVTFDATATPGLDVIQTKKIQVRALVSNTTGDILRTGAGGTATVTGDAPGSGSSHASLTATGTPISDADISRLWKDVTVTVEESDGSGQWTGLKLLNVTATSAAKKRQVNK